MPQPETRSNPMISDPITDHKQAAILLRQIQFAWTALGEKNRSQDPLEEIVTEWNARTDEIAFSRNTGDREFNWIPKGKDLIGKLKGKSFRNVPELVTFRAKWKVDLTSRSLEEFQYWLDAIASHGLDGTGLTLALAFVYPVYDQQALAACTWGMQCNETRRGHGEIPFRCTLEALNSIPIGVEQMIDQIGIDQDLNQFHGDLGKQVSDDNAHNGMRVALTGLREPQLFARILSTLKEAASPGTKVSSTIYCPLNGYGHILTVDSPDPDDIALALEQKEKMDQLLELILNSKSARDWELVINCASERNTCGAGWDRRGSVLEHHDTKIEITRLRSGKKQHKVFLHYHEGEYRIEIEGMDADSQAGRIFSGWGVPFH